MKLRAALWPLSLPYLAWPHRCEFLNDFMDDFSPLADSTVIARDGLVPLLWFFHHYPKPGALNFRFLVHSSLAGYIPESWRERVGTYQVESLLPETGAPPAEIVFCGLTSNSHCTLESLERRLAQLKGGFSQQNWQQIAKTVFVLLRLDSRPSLTDSFESAFLLGLGRLLGGPATAVDWYGLETRENFGDSLFVDLNDGLLCADSYVRHLILSRGGHEFSHAPRDGRGELIELSQMHGLRIHSTLSTSDIRPVVWDAGFAREYKAYCQQMQSLAPKTVYDSFFGWPPWFESWCMAGYGRGVALVP